MIILIDNYDSFTYNLVQRLGEIGLREPSLRHELRVFRNDEVTVDQLAESSPTHLIVSPGPCAPLQSGISNDAIKHFIRKIPILGVCLGHQCIGHVFGASVSQAPRIMHGKTSPIHHDGRTIFRGLSKPFTAARYHSLTVLPDTLPPEFEITARTDQNELMAIRHRTAPLEGIQFHPESFLTTEGSALLANFLKQ
ncbi:MAG TPA: aminodeoxychorismate/anthranilate synthase component II [Phycisphaerae bacterium]|nr:aminodeoxychorismate/anthranilate synthase component II [Phycisphaerae bacterium]